jgi:hypothetical protein
MGTIVNGTYYADPTHLDVVKHQAKLYREATKPPKNSIVAILLLLVAICFMNRFDDPFRNKTIPASARSPHEHVSFFQANPLFVTQTMERYGNHTNSRTALLEEELLNGGQRYDFGGDHGHTSEAMRPEDIKSIRTTRCSTTNAATVAYFCGLERMHNRSHERNPFRLECLSISSKLTPTTRAPLCTHSVSVEARQLTTPDFLTFSPL